MKTEINSPAKVIADNLDTRWAGNTIFNHYDNPKDFMQDVINTGKDANNSKASELIDEGIEAYKDIKKVDIKYNTLYQDVAKKVKEKLVARGFTTKLLYGNVSFTAENTGMMSKQRAMLGRRDCYFANPKVTDGNLFHDIYINLSYSYGIHNSTIEKNSYALYALTKELARVIPIRVFVVNHVGTDTPTCYSYNLKKFGMPIQPENFLFFTSHSKRTFGWATYDLICKGNNDSTVGQPENTVSIADFSLDAEIDTIFKRLNVAKLKAM